MSSTFTGINMATEALHAFTTAMDTIGNNLSNINTPNYSRQVVNYLEQQPTVETYGSTFNVGNGVSIANITSVRDLFLLSRQLSSSSDLGNTNQLLKGNQLIQNVFNENGTSSTISDDLSNFYNSWSSLASNPSDTANLIAVQQAGATLSNDVRSAYAQISDQATQTTTDIKGAINNIQNYANQLATINQEIRDTRSTGGTPNTLVDQSQALLQKLSAIVNISTQANADGTVNVNINQFQLINQTGANQFPTNYNAANGTVSDANGTYNITNGQLAGLFSQSLAQTNAMGNLDNIANSLRTQVNSLMSTGTTGLGTTGQNFFQDVTPPAPQTGAINFQLDPAVAANYKAIAAGVTGNGGDGGLALAIAQANNTAVPGLGNVSISTYYTNMLSSLGTTVQALTSQQSTQQSLDTQVQNQIQSVSGVSIDEEMANMVKMQQSYQAAAKSLSMVDQNLQYLMTMMPT